MDLDWRIAQRAKTPPPQKPLGARELEIKRLKQKALEFNNFVFDLWLGGKDADNRN